MTNSLETLDLEHDHSWDFWNPVKIIFGKGRLLQLSDVASGQRLLFVTTPGSTSRGLTQKVIGLLQGSRIEVLDNVKPNLDIAILDSHIQRFSSQSFDSILAVGGGSALDTAKALSVGVAPAARGFSLRRHLENGEALPQCPFVPIIAVPTTAGTGSEVTPFATVWDLELKKKYGLSSPKLYPKIALLDPELTLDLPASITITTGLDALSQGLDSIWNRNANSLTLPFARAAVAIACEGLTGCGEKLDNLHFRSQMLKASLLSGLAISQTRTALAHSISYPLTAHFGVPHGLACAFALPEILRFNAHSDDGRLVELARSLACKSVDSLGAKLEVLIAECHVHQTLQEYCPDLANLMDLAASMITPGRTENNLRSVEVEDIKGILKQAFLKIRS